MINWGNCYFFKIKIIPIKKISKSLFRSLKTYQMKEEKTYSKTLNFLLSLDQKCIMALISEKGLNSVQDYPLNLSV